MTLKQALARLKALGNEKVRAQNAKNGAGDNQFGVRLGDIRKVAKEAKTDHELALGRTSPFAPIWIDAMVSRQG